MALLKPTYSFPAIFFRKFMTWRESRRRVEVKNDPEVHVWRSDTTNDKSCQLNSTYKTSRVPLNIFNTHRAAGN